MKIKMKNLVALYIIILSIGTIVSLYIPKQETAAQETITIPDEAIRLRILANSDMEKDQEIKRLVRDEVNKEITKWVQNLTSLEYARNIIKSRLPELKQIAVDVVEREGVDQTVSIEFGPVQFPTKLYGQFLYPAGEYEAVLITLGEGEGANWWCVLYPPLCFLDFSTGNAVRSPGFEETVEASGKEDTKETDVDETEVTVEEKAEANVEVTSDNEDFLNEVEEKAEPTDVEITSENESVQADLEVEEKREVTTVTKSADKLVTSNDEVEGVDKKEKIETENVDNTVSVEKSEPVYVDEEEEEEVEVRFFILDVVKGLFN